MLFFSAKLHININIKVGRFEDTETAKENKKYISLLKTKQNTETLFRTARERNENVFKFAEGRAAFISILLLATE